MNDIATTLSGISHTNIKVLRILLAQKPGAELSCRQSRAIFDLVQFSQIQIFKTIEKIKEGKYNV